MRAGWAVVDALVGREIADRGRPCRWRVSPAAAGAVVAAVVLQFAQQSARWVSPGCRTRSPWLGAHPAAVRAADEVIAQRGGRAGRRPCSRPPGCRTGPGSGEDGAGGRATVLAVTVSAARVLCGGIINVFSDIIGDCCHFDGQLAAPHVDRALIAFSIVMVLSFRRASPPVIYRAGPPSSPNVRRSSTSRPSEQMNCASRSRNYLWILEWVKVRKPLPGSEI